MKRWIFLLTLLFLVPIYFSITSCTDKEKISAVIYDGEELNGGHPLPFRLYQNYPNPFNTSTNIEYSIEMEMYVTIKVFTEDWLEVETLVDKSLDVGGMGIGHYIVQFRPPSELPSGEYYYTMEALGYTIVRKMMLVK